MFRHPAIQNLLNLQPDQNGQVKPYQVGEFLELVREYNLNLED